MIQLRFHCPHCDLPMRLSRWDSLENLNCPSCQRNIPTYVDAKAKEQGLLDHCLLCNAKELFRQKLFNRNLGIGIVVFGVVISILLLLFPAQSPWLNPTVPILAVALIDLLLYWLLPSMLVCYACDAEHRGFQVTPNFKLYDHLKAARVKDEPTYPGAEESH
ncbi:MAG: hypothetical protein KDK66_05895 [Deltaproteobacteria bacterium]|nr:hypothetical protein [Deltaproteobacteria bacterium]